MKKLFLIISMLTMGFVFNGCEKDDPNTNSNSNVEEGCGDPEANNYDEDAEPCEDDECCEYGCDSDNVAMFDASGDNTEISLTYGSISEYGCYKGFCNKDISLSNDDGFGIYLELFYIDGGEFETSYVFGDDTIGEPYFSDSSDCMYNESYYYFEDGTVEIIDNGDNTHEVIFMLNSDEGIEITGSYCGLLDEDKSLRSKKARK